MSEFVLNVPGELRRGGRRSDQSAYLASADKVINIICKSFGLETLAGKHVLDMGCGTKLVQAILDRGLPIGRYTGFDVGKEMIEYLQTSVDDERFGFHHMNTHNEMYNPDGIPLDPAIELPLERESVDIICLFSVFTHLAPQDYGKMLKLLRPYIKSDGHIIYSLFVNEVTPGGYGYIDKVDQHLRAHPEKLTKKAISAAQANPEKPDFIDDDPGKPLLRALYSRKHALELVEGTGWEVDALHDPEPGIQHYMICKPA